MAGERMADLDSGSGSERLTFVYTVQPTDRDDDGIWVGNHASDNQTLQLDADDAITSLGGTDANLEHDILDLLPDHKVDGSRTADEAVEPVNQPSEINAYWTESGTKGSNLQAVCTGAEPFRAFWLPPVKSVTGSNTRTYKVADEWEAEVTSKNGASGETYTIRVLSTTIMSILS